MIELRAPAPGGISIVQIAIDAGRSALAWRRRVFRSVRRLGAAPVLCAVLVYAAPPARADFTQQGEKLFHDVNSSFGNAVALSADGNTALVGERDRVTLSGAGAAVIFVRTKGVWAPQWTLLADNVLQSAVQGWAVALSADGNTALVGGPGDNLDQGAAWVFTRSGDGWTQQAKLFGTGALGMARQGRSVALSADGDTALVGGDGDNSNSGAVWVFTRSGGSWSQQGAKLVGDAGSSFGWSVALSQTGDTALVGKPTYNSGAGAAVIFVRNSGVWTLQSGLLGTGAAGNAGQGKSVALSADGGTAIVGGDGDNSNAGAVWVFTRSGSSWSQQGAKLVGTGATGKAEQGGSVALSANGNIALVGGPLDNTYAGATWVFTRSGTTWSQQGSKLVGTGPSGIAEQGFSVALSADGYTALIGGLRDNDSGAAWVFIRPRPNTHDFNGDVQSDILWRHSSGQVAMWLMNGVSVLQGPGVGGATADWQIVSQRDFNGDGKHDILWRNTGSGQVILWVINGAAVTQSAGVGSATSDWQIVGTGDFNADGKADILWRNSSSGQVVLWTMNGATVTQAAGVGGAATDWQVASVGDFNGDGKADILWRHSSGTVAAWLMNGASVTQAGTVGGATTDWQIVGTGDFDGDGRSDILWRHDGGIVAAWLLNGVSVSQSAGVGGATIDWQIVSTGDFDGDGKSDIIWRHSGGAVAAWLLNGVTVTQSAGIGGATTDWVIQTANAN